MIFQNQLTFNYLNDLTWFLPIDPMFFFGNSLGRARLGKFCTFFSCIFILLNVCIKSPGFPLINVFQCMFLENRNRLQLYIHTQYPIAKQKMHKTYTSHRNLGLNITKKVVAQNIPIFEIFAWNVLLLFGSL